MRSYTTKRIELPGGRFVEVVVFGGGEADAPVTEAPEVHDHHAAHGVRIPAGTELHVCPECEGHLVFPVSWEERVGSTWQITLRCPDCEWWHTDDYDGESVDRFDDVLNDGTEQLLSDLRTFARANMEEDVERLVRAIGQDLILPMDF